MTNKEKEKEISFCKDGINYISVEESNKRIQEEKAKTLKDFVQEGINIGRLLERKDVKEKIDNFWENGKKVRVDSKLIKENKKHPNLNIMKAVCIREFSYEQFEELLSSLDNVYYFHNNIMEER